MRKSTSCYAIIVAMMPAASAAAGLDIEFIFPDTPYLSAEDSPFDLLSKGTEVHGRPSQISTQTRSRSLAVHLRIEFKATHGRTSMRSRFMIGRGTHTLPPSSRAGRRRLGRVSEPLRRGAPLVPSRADTNRRCSRI